MDLALLLVGQNGQGMKGQNRPSGCGKPPLTWTTSPDRSRLSTLAPSVKIAVN
jgi:hypothetical protein